MSNEEERVWLPDQDLGKHVKHLRENVLGLTQAALGEALGYAEKSAQPTVWQIEEGKRSLPEEKMVRLARLADVSVTYFMVPEFKNSAKTGAGWSRGYEAALNRIQTIVEELRVRPHPEPVADLADHVAKGIAMSAQNDVDADERNGSQG